MKKMVGEQDIRDALRLEIEKLYRDEEGTLVVEELGLCEGDARIDIAVVNGALVGYEIKSEADTLKRLPHQVAVYSRLMDQVTLVAGTCHLEDAESIIPGWWGMTAVVELEGTVEFEFKVVRQPENNPKIDPFSLAQLLWRDEALGLLRQFGVQKGMLSKGRDDIWKKLCEVTTIEDLSELVRRQLRSRENWPSAKRVKMGCQIRRSKGRFPTQDDVSKAISGQNEIAGEAKWLACYRGFIAAYSD